MKAGGFRADLLYRLNVLTLVLPPLRERPDDILPLVRHYLERAARQHRGPKRLHPDAEARLLGHSWPGNVRELATVLERVVLLHDGDEIHDGDLGFSGAARGDVAVEVGASGVHVDFSQGGVSLAQVERTLIVEALAAARNNRRRAAELLDISLETLRYRLEKHGIEPGEASRDDDKTRRA